MTNVYYFELKDGRNSSTLTASEVAGLDVGYDVANYELVTDDPTLRRLAQNFYVVRRSLVPFCVVARRIRRKVGVDEQTKQIQDLYAMGMPLLDTKRIFSPPLWKMFNSYSRKELPKKDWPAW